MVKLKESSIIICRGQVGNLFILLIRVSGFLYLDQLARFKKVARAQRSDYGRFKNDLYWEWLQVTSI